jgi:hypothetical protein
MFDGNGYLSFPISETKSIRHLTSFSLEIKTEATDGMILWIGEVSLTMFPSEFGHTKYAFLFTYSTHRNF